MSNARQVRCRSGGAWELWVVSREGRDVGYLVTTSDRCPEPIAFIPGIGQASLELAVMVRADHAKIDECRVSDVVDLRNVPIDRLPPFVAGMPLWPVDAIGRRIRTHRTFEGGMYVRDSGGGVAGFFLCTHGAMADLAERYSGHKKSGASVAPLTPKLGGRKGEEAGYVTAA